MNGGARSGRNFDVNVYGGEEIEARGASRRIRWQRKITRVRESQDLYFHSAAGVSSAAIR
jgi:hypothetical protein